MNPQSMLHTFVAASGSTFAATAIKATVALLAALLLIRVARRASASLRHLLAAATFGVLLFLPLAASLVPPRVVRVDAPAVKETGAVRASSPAPAQRRAGGPLRTDTTPTFDWRSAAFNVYLGGVALFVISVLGGIWRVRQIRDRAEVSVAGTGMANEMARSIGTYGGIQVFVSQELAVPITFGFSRPIILLPAETGDWTEEEMRCAIRHELEHIARGDWATQIASRLACAVYWPHPFVWALWSRLRLEAERACDDAVIRGSAEPESYAQQLVSLARRLVGRGKVPALAMATRGNLGIRVEAILDRRLRRAPLSRYASLGVLAAAMAGLLAIAPFQVMSAAAVDAASGKERHRPKYGDGDSRILDVALLEASARGDLQQMHSLMERGANADARIPGDGTPLLAAAKYGELDAMRTLIEAGADVNAGIGGDGNAITAAAKSGYLEAVQFLLDNGADIDRGVEGDGNALIMASDAGHTDIVQYLLDRGADIEKVVAGDENPLIHASESGQTEVAKLLLSRGANVNARVWVERGDGGRSAGEWRTALKWAQRNGNKELIDVLVRAGARE